MSRAERLTQRARARSAIRVARQLRDRVDELTFAPPVRFVYNPLRYAWKGHREYLARYAGGSREVLLLGMNPGPWGMAQTGVPFGDVTSVRDWLGIEARVDRPLREHPARAVLGFDCARGEVSGRRLWGWARERFGTPERFFARFFVINYCPLCFLEAGGRNRTPDRLPAAERETLFAHCDSALRALVRQFRPDHVVGIGRFAERRLHAALAGAGPAVSAMPHPSPASPQANRGWGKLADRALAAAGIRVD